MRRDIACMDKLCIHCGCGLSGIHDDSTGPRPLLLDLFSGAGGAAVDTTVRVSTLSGSTSSRNPTTRSGSTGTTRCSSCRSTPRRSTLSTLATVPALLPDQQGQQRQPPGLPRRRRRHTSCTRAHRTALRDRERARRTAARPGHPVRRDVRAARLSGTGCSSRTFRCWRPNTRGTAAGCTVTTTGSTTRATTSPSRATVVVPTARSTTGSPRWTSTGSQRNVASRRPCRPPPPSWSAHDYSPGCSGWPRERNDEQMPRENQERPLSEESGRPTPLTPSRRHVKGSPMSNPQRPTPGLTEPLPPMDGKARIRDGRPSRGFIDS